MKTMIAPRRAWYSDGLSGLWSARPGGDGAGSDRFTRALAGAGIVLAGAGAIWAVRRVLPRLHYAPGWPGQTPHWAPSDKSGVGTALTQDINSMSLVWFTLWHGALSEVFYPRMDHPCTRGLSMVVTDGRRFISDERCDAEHRVEYLSEGVPAYRLTNTCRQGRYRIEKVIIAHPYQNAIIVQTRFTPLRGARDDYHLFTVLDPHLGLRRGVGSTAWVDEHKGRQVLQADRGDYAVSLACSTPWRDVSVGYAGSVSGPWRDLSRHGRLTGHYSTAPWGNVLMTAEIDLRKDDGAFTLALGFGHTPGEASHRASVGADDDFEALLASYSQGWRDWQQTLLSLEETERGERDLYRTSTMVLRTHEAKTIPGAIVASLSIPWGQAFRDESKGPGQGGYHLVWPRDLVEIAGGLAACGASGEARRALDYLRSTQSADGHWPQNMWVDGAPFWSGLQLGETALVILLADLLSRDGYLSGEGIDGYWPMIRRAARHIVRVGPASQEDRWEDWQGFTPFTLSALIAALVVAAECADRNGEPEVGRFLRETADAWNDSIEEWTYVEGTKLARRAGISGYYLRVAPTDSAGEPVKHGDSLTFWYRPIDKKKHRPDQIVSPDALAYVRFGLRAPDDPRIVNTLKVIDMILKVETPFGPCWHRYNHDGYGEKTDGSPFDGKTGHGRAWPLLTGERAHHELAAGHRDEAVRLLRAVEQFAGDGGLIPEQVWDTYDIPKHDLYFGRPAGSAMPLAWAHAEYIKLRRSLRDGRVFDLPPQTVKRYLVDQVQAAHRVWRVDHRRSKLPAGRVLRVELPGPAAIHWRANGGANGAAVSTRDSGLGIHYADLPTDQLPPGSRISFSISWRGAMFDKKQTLVTLIKSFSVEVVEDNRRGGDQTSAARPEVLAVEH